MKDIKTLKNMIVQLVEILNAGQRKRMVGMFFVILLGSLFELLGITIILPFIQALTNPDELMEKDYIRILINFLGINDERYMLVVVGIGIILVYIIKNLYLSLVAYLQADYINRTNREISVSMLKAYLNRPYEFFVDNGSATIVMGVNRDTEGVYRVMGTLFRLLTNCLLIALISVYLIMTDLVMAVGVLVAGLCCFIIIVLVLKKPLARMGVSARTADREKNKWVLQSSDGIKDIMVFNRKDYFLQKFNNSYLVLNKANTLHDFSNSLPVKIIEGICVSGIIMTVLIRLRMNIDINDFVPKMAVFAMGAFRILPSVSDITGNVNALVYLRPMLEAAHENITAARVFLNEILKETSDDDYNIDLKFNNIVSIESLSWQYSQGKDKVLDDLNLTIKKGESIGIIGESGSGKSTLADILLRLYRPQTGGIYMDGIDINTISNTWARIVSYVPQNIFLMDDTIRNNVAFGAECVDDNDIWEALKKASIDIFIKELPDGLDTIVGDKGIRFSGGQRQRIAIARALYIKPQILILDEATSALDNETEESVMEAIDVLAGSITLVIIAHRITTLKNCDKIYEIVNGKAVERKKADIMN